MFDSMEEITQKLGNCVVIHRGRPFFVYGGKSRTSLHGFYPDTGAEAAITLKDPDLDFRNLGEKLGYINIENYNQRAYRECLYLMRQPVRRSIQGLSQTNMFVSGFQGNPRNINLPRHQPSFQDPIYRENAPAFTAMLNNQYPTLATIRREMTTNPDITSRAFHRDWCILRDHSGIGPFKLIYKMDKVGYTEDIDRLVLAPRFKLMQKDLNNANRAAA